MFIPLEPPSLQIKHLQDQMKSYALLHILGFCSKKVNSFLVVQISMITQKEPLSPYVNRKGISTICCGFFKGRTHQKSVPEE